MEVMNDDSGVFDGDEDGEAMLAARNQLRTLFPGADLDLALDELVKQCVNKQMAAVKRRLRGSPQLLSCVRVMFMDVMVNNGLREFAERRSSRESDADEPDEKWDNLSAAVEDWMESTFQEMGEHVRERLTAAEYPTLDEEANLEIARMNQDIEEAENDEAAGEIEAEKEELVEESLAEVLRSDGEALSGLREQITDDF